MTKKEKKREEKPKVLLALPTGTGHLCKELMAYIGSVFNHPKYDVHCLSTTRMPVEANRSLQVQTFLEGEYIAYVSIDDDNPPIVDPMQLIQLDLDIVGCVTPVWQHREVQPFVHWNVYRRVDGKGYTNQERRSEIQEVDAIGTGCFVVQRRVFEHPDMLGCFTRLYQPDGTVKLGSDLVFCERAKEAGFKVWAAWEYPCQHYKEIDLLDVVKFMARVKELARSGKIYGEPDGEPKEGTPEQADSEADAAAV